MSRLRVRYATVFVLPPAGRGKAPVVSTSPERLVVRRGDTIEWTVVNASGVPGRVSFAWKEVNPLKGGSAEPFDRRARDMVVRKAPKGVHKYSVLLNGKELFDPEIEIMS
jgi:hypothetical protein